MEIFKNLKLMMLSVCIALAMSACNNNKKTEAMQEENNISLFPKGDSLPKEWFTGNAFLQPLLAKDKNNDFALGSVTFEPGVRTIWHTHPKGQVLIVTEGKGWYQEKGKPAQSIKKGDVVNIPENLEHWHGAAADSKMVHIAITNYKGEENVTWLQPVTDADYNEVNKK
ncbi:cupin domain-containing protein [Pedobacter heparinus]|uniref:(R)-mandelonitrile lyase n=1 Tax=Pedobacter heparinus TaxID=984 RepID=UPI0029302206|nr:cupin domain-containing protein [Pedobacter heparinus]